MYVVDLIVKRGGLVEATELIQGLYEDTRNVLRRDGGQQKGGKVGGNMDQKPHPSTRQVCR